LFFHAASYVIFSREKWKNINFVKAFKTTSNRISLRIEEIVNKC